MKFSRGIWAEYARLVRSPRRTLVGIAVLTALGLAVILPIPLVIAYALDTAIPDGQTALLVGIGGVLLAAQVLGAGLTVWRRHLVVTNTKAATTRLRHRLVKKMYEVPIDYHKHRELGTVHDWIVQETQRVDRMIDAGLVDEVRDLLDRPGGLGPVARQALGYREIADWLEGRLGSREEAVEILKRRTKTFARRQLTWFKHFDVRWVDVARDDEPAAIAERALRALGL